jgi:uncharacterized protein YaiE (UPF0345 family)
MDAWKECKHINTTEYVEITPPRPAAATAARSVAGSRDAGGVTWRLMRRSALSSFSPMSIPSEFNNVTAVAKANVYFDGKVVSHTIRFSDGTKKTLGLIYPGKYHFGTDLAERMEIVSGQCVVRLDGSQETRPVSAGSQFDVPAKSGFDIEVPSGICEYICSFLP